MFAPKQTLFKVKPPGQILPAGPPEATAQVDDVQVDDGSTAKGTAPSAGTSKPVTSQGFHPGLLGVHPFVAILAAYVNRAESNVDHARRAVDAAAHGDGYHAADHALQIAQGTAEEAGKVAIDAGRGAVALPGDVKDVIGAGNNDERIAAAGDVVEDVVGIGGAVVLLGGAFGKPSASQRGPDTSALSQRATQIHAALDPIAAGQKTTAVLQTNGGNIVAGGARDLSPFQRSLLFPEEIAAKLPGAHAEVTVLNHAAKAGLAPRALAVTRVFCPECAQAIEAAGGQITSPTTAIWP